MIGIKFTEEQLEFFLKDTRYQTKTVLIFKEFYVNGKSGDEIIEESGQSRSFVYKKLQEFEKLIKNKMLDLNENLEFVTVLVPSNKKDLILKSCFTAS